jgi:hypothetical protein
MSQKVQLKLGYNTSLYRTLIVFRDSLHLECQVVTLHIVFHL